MATKAATRAEDIPVLKRREAKLNAARNQAAAALDDCIHREEAYLRCRRGLGDAVADRMIADAADRAAWERDNPGCTRRGYAWDARLGARPQPEDRARCEEILLDVETELADLQRQIREAGPFDPPTVARAQGHAYFTKQEIKLNDVTYLPGQGVPASALDGLDRAKVQQLLGRYGPLFEV